MYTILPDTTVSASQRPKKILLKTSFGLFLIVLPKLNLPLVSAGRLKFPFLLRCVKFVFGI